MPSKKEVGRIATDTAAFNEISRVTGLFPREQLPFISARPALA